MSPRNFTRAVTSAARAGQPRRSETFGRLQPGDLFRVARKPGTWRFRAALLDADADVTSVEAYGPVPGQPGNRSGQAATAVRSFRPEDVIVPSTRALNNQRRRRAAEREDEQ